MLSAKQSINIISNRYKTIKQKPSFIDITMKLFQNRYNRLDMHC